MSGDDLMSLAEPAPIRLMWTAAEVEAEVIAAVLKEREACWRLALDWGKEQAPWPDDDATLRARKKALMDASVQIGQLIHARGRA
jgi:hypothetical protein